MGIFFIIEDLIYTSIAFPMLRAKLILTNSSWVVVFYLQVSIVMFLLLLTFCLGAPLVELLNYFLGLLFCR